MESLFVWLFFLAILAALYTWVPYWNGTAAAAATAAATAALAPTSTPGPAAVAASPPTPPLDTVASVNLAEPLTLVCGLWQWGVFLLVAGAVLYVVSLLRENVRFAHFENERMRAMMVGSMPMVHVGSRWQPVTAAWWADGARDEPAPDEDTINREERLQDAAAGFSFAGQRFDQGGVQYAAMSEERQRLRNAWRDVARAFLRAGEPFNYSKRKMARKLKLPPDTWQLIVAQLGSMGLLVKRGVAHNAPWVVPTGDDGGEMTIEQLLNDGIWFTPFRLVGPPPTLPKTLVLV